MKAIARIAASIAASLILVSARPGATAPVTGGTFESFVQSALSEYLKNGTPGAIVVYVARPNGRLQTGFVPSGTSGWAGSNVPVTGSTVFEIGSVTKVFTATLAEIALAQSKNLHLDSPVGPTLKGYPGVTPSTTFNAITLGELATHSAGLPDNGVAGHPSDALFQDRAPTAQMKNFWNTWPKGSASQPGRCWRYSNSGFVTLGFAASQLLQPGPTSHYDNQLMRTVLSPLAMNCTDANLAHIRCTPVAKGTLLQAGGKKKRVTTNASDLKSDAVDLQYWLDAELGIDSERGPIPPALAAAIKATQQIQFRDLPVCDKPQSKRSMALGWDIVPLDPKNPGRGVLYVKNGATSLGGMSDALAFSLDHQAAIAVLTNAVQSGKDGAAEDTDSDSDDTSSPKKPQALANFLLRQWIARGLQ